MKIRLQFLVPAFLLLAACHRKPECPRPTAAAAPNYWSARQDTTFVSGSSWHLTPDGLQELQFSPVLQGTESYVISFRFTAKPVQGGTFRVVPNPAAADEVGIRASLGIRGPFSGREISQATVQISQQQNKLTLTGGNIPATLGVQSVFDSTRLSFRLTEF